MVRVLAFRRDGFNGPIAVEVDGLPGGVSCQPASAGTGTNANLAGLHFHPEEADRCICHHSCHGQGANRCCAGCRGQARFRSERGHPHGPYRNDRVGRDSSSRPASARISRELGLCVIDELGTAAGRDRRGTRRSESKSTDSHSRETGQTQRLRQQCHSDVGRSAAKRTSRDRADQRRHRPRSCSGFSCCPMRRWAPTRSC